jgi:hypothetical protein
MFVRDSVIPIPLLWQNKQDWAFDQEKYGENYEYYKKEDEESPLTTRREEFT